MRLVNIGCGLHAPDGWMNIDSSFSLTLSRHPRIRQALHAMGVIRDDHLVDWPESIVRHDVTSGLPFPPDSVDAIYSSHMLEHLYLNDARRLVHECQRVLKEGGILRLALPDGDRWAQDMVDGVSGPEPTPGVLFNDRIHAHPFDPPSLRRRLASFVGGAPHRWQPTRDLLQWMLVESGFREVEFPAEGKGRCPRLSEVEHRPESLHVEAMAQKREPMPSPPPLRETGHA